VPYCGKGAKRNKWKIWLQISHASLSLRISGPSKERWRGFISEPSGGTGHFKGIEYFVLFPALKDLDADCAAERFSAIANFGHPAFPEINELPWR
jgi:hypothetical protein